MSVSVGPRQWKWERLKPSLSQKGQNCGEITQKLNASVTKGQQTNTCTALGLQTTPTGNFRSVVKELKATAIYADFLKTCN